MAEDNLHGWQYLRSEQAVADRYSEVKGSLSARDKAVILANVASIKDPPVRVSAVTLLLDDGARVEDVAGSTALHNMFGAIRHEFADEAKLLQRMLTVGGDLNARDRRGRTPLDPLVRFHSVPESALQPIYDVAFAWAEQPGSDGRPRGLHVTGGLPEFRPILSAWLTDHRGGSDADSSGQ